MEGLERAVVVIDTNVVLDLFVFQDPATASLRQALHNRAIWWISTQDMRTELARVLAYAHIVPRLAFYQLTAADVLAQFDRHAHIEPVAPRCTAICKDPDDQRFIDLAVVYGALLLSKDKAVLCMKKRLQVLGVTTKFAI